MFGELRVQPLEVELRADLEEPGLQHVRRLQPVAGGRGRERVVQRKRPVAVEQVVAVEIHAEAILVELAQV